ncbi:MAG: hypothetical protein IT503_17955 [Burkholderiaceae bacterium]|nr:hypothetical protein [Burkholderiaceae bacterium]
MYSYEDQLRSLAGQRVGLTICQLGYPTKNALKQWHREYKRRLDLSTGYVRRPKYSQAQKELAVEHYLEHGRCLAATNKALELFVAELLLHGSKDCIRRLARACVVRSQELTPAMKQSAGACPEFCV